MNIIISIDSCLNNWSYHVIRINPMMGTTTTIKIGSINNKNDIKTLVEFLESKDYKSTIQWWKSKLDLIHCTITVSYGPTIRSWIKENNKYSQKEVQNG